MATLTVRLPDDKHNRLKALARRKKMSVNKLIEEISTQTLAEFDSETRFRTFAASGDVKRGLELLDKLDARQGEHGRSQWQKLLIGVYLLQPPNRSDSSLGVHAICELNHLVIHQFF